jgi:Lrp/AsnC ligand binding domain
MLSAYVLIQTEVGKAGQVAEAIGGIDGVQRVEDVAGPYDVIARVQAPGMDELGRLVVARIQAVDGVTRTLTCTMIRANPGRRHRLGTPAARPALAVRARPRVVQAVDAGRRPAGPRFPGAIGRVSTGRPRSHCQGVFANRRRPAPSRCQAIVGGLTAAPIRCCLPASSW